MDGAAPSASAKATAPKPANEQDAAGAIETSNAPSVGAHSSRPKAGYDEPVISAENGTTSAPTGTHDQPVESKPAPKATPSADAAKHTPMKKRSQLGEMAHGAKRKKRTSLAEMSAAATAKPVKLNTLEKSKLDWEAFKGTRASEVSETMTEEERDELESQTHGGGSGLGSIKGYIHRKEFLDRVHERIESQEQEARSRS